MFWLRTVQFTESSLAKAVVFMSTLICDFKVNLVSGNHAINLAAFELMPLIHMHAGNLQPSWLWEIIIGHARTG